MPIFCVAVSYISCNLSQNGIADKLYKTLYCVTHSVTYTMYSVTYSVKEVGASPQRPTSSQSGDKSKRQKRWTVFCPVYSVLSRLTAHRSPRMPMNLKSATNLRLYMQSDNLNTNAKISNLWKLQVIKMNSVNPELSSIFCCTATCHTFSKCNISHSSSCHLWVSCIKKWNHAIIRP